jgi:hypothetical protein
MNRLIALFLAAMIFMPLIAIASEPLGGASSPQIPVDAVLFEVGEYACPSDIAPGIYALYADTSQRSFKYSSIAVRKEEELLEFASAGEGGLCVFSINEGESFELKYRNGLINPIKNEKTFIHSPGDWYKLVDDSGVLVGVHIPPGEYLLVSNSQKQQGILRIKEGRDNLTINKVDIGDAVTLVLKDGQVITSYFLNIILIIPDKNQ